MNHPVCRHCGKAAYEIAPHGAYLTRTNPKGVPGVWECLPNCATALWVVRKGGAKSGKLARHRGLNDRYPMDHGFGYRPEPVVYFEWVSLEKIRNPPHYTTDNPRVWVRLLDEDTAKAWAKECHGIALRVEDVPEMNRSQAGGEG